MSHNRHRTHNIADMTQGLSTINVACSADTLTTGDDEALSDVDEPPDNRILFKKLFTSGNEGRASSIGHDCIASSSHDPERKGSLLTQALLSSPELHPSSDAEAFTLTSDSGLTSPTRTTTPSPPLPSFHAGLGSFALPEKQSTDTGDGCAENKHDALKVGMNRPGELGVEAGLGRKRCISFACGRQPYPQTNNGSSVTKPDHTNPSPIEAPDPPKRPCMLKFVCPMRPSRVEASKTNMRSKSPNPPRVSTLNAKPETIITASEYHDQVRRDSNMTIKERLPQIDFSTSVSMKPRKGKAFNRKNYQDCEATRFHAFGNPLDAGDEWTNEQTAFRQRITINDTLRKENAIRKLAEEAEEEVSDEEDENLVSSDTDDALNRPSVDINDDVSDDGNQTDDEEGFADSDDDSDANSDYQFWTPGLTTAATSTEFLDHIRPLAHRATSESSFESTIHTQDASKRHSKELFLKIRNVRPKSPEIPDSSDFVIGTIDEDRPLEEAYLSCLEQRRWSRHKMIPQDIDPSFPTSEPDAEDDSSEEADIVPNEDGPKHRVETEGPAYCKENTSPHPSPDRKQMSPSKRSNLHRSPPPQRLFGQSKHRLRSPPPSHRRVVSPPSSRRPSFNDSRPCATQEIEMPRLAQRPNLTHTTSLPRTPNPFWGHHRRSRLQDVETPSTGISPRNTGSSRLATHSRGPIDIVQGLETKRQRRKDKFWRQHCRTSTRDRSRCHPGKGAERMRELGLEMADRCRGYGQKAPLVLSI